MIWIRIWEIVLVIGISLYALTVIYIIPRGIKDVIDFFRNLTRL